MKKQLQFLSILLTLTILLTGCGLEHAEEARPTLDPAAWPTPKPDVAAASPTPFPKATLPPTVTPSASSATVTQVTTPVVTETTASPALSELELGDTGGGLAQVTMPGAGLAPVAAALVTTDGLALHQRPDSASATLGTLVKGELAGVIGRNAGGDWLYVLTVSSAQGWVPANALRVTGASEETPVLPDNPLALAAAARPATGAASSEAAQPAAAPPLALTDLQPVTTARVNREAINMRQGPGPDYDVLDTLAADEQIDILALNRKEDWALVRTSQDKFGWVSLGLIAVDGSLAGAPTVLSATPDQDIPAGQIAPILGLAGATGAPSSGQAESETSSTEPGVPASPAVAVQANPAPTAGNDLGPIAQARIARNEVEVRPGPGTDYAPIDQVTDNQEELIVLAVDQSQNWVLVDPAVSKTGWVALADLAVTGSLAGAPQVVTAWVESNAVEARSGPGIFHEVVGPLAINSFVSVLGLNEGRSWALIKPIPGGPAGWVQVQFLKVAGRLADLPEAPELPPPAPGAPAGQVAAAPPIPARPVSESQIVFQTTSGGDIMIIKPDGSGLRRLTNGIDPVLSPDGQTVAFTRWEGETGSLWLINTDGTNERSVLGFIKQAKGPEWSPDGTQIVLNFQHGGRLDYKTECTLLQEGRQPPRPPREAKNIRVNLGSGGAKLCWDVPPDPHWGLRLINLADGSFKDVDGGAYAFRPAWDPSRPWRIISDGGRGLLEVDINRDYRQPITDEINDGSPVFSPDGRYLAVTLGQRGGGPGHNIYRLNADGSGRLRLTQTPLWVPVLPDGGQAWNNVAPTWSPDGAQIAFLTDRAGRWEIWVMNADGSDPHPLFPEEVNNQLQLSYNFVDERVLSWR